MAFAAARRLTWPFPFVLAFVLFATPLAAPAASAAGTTHSLSTAATTSTSQSSALAHSTTAQQRDSEEDGGDDDSCSAGEGFGPLNELISTLKIDIPDISITTIKDLEYLNISKLSCDHIAIGDIEIGASGPAAQPVIELDLSGITVECTFTLKAKISGILGPKFDGNVDASLSKIGASVGAALTFEPVPGSPEYQAPVSSKSTGCSLSLKTDLHFSGGILPELLNILKGVLESLIDTEVKKAGCAALNGLLTNSTTQLLQFIDKGVAQFAPPPKPRPPPSLPYGEHMVPISKNKLLHGIAGLLDQPAALNRVVDCLTNHTGVASVNNLNVTVNLGDDNLTTTNFTLQNISISGLDTFAALKLLQPGSDGGDPTLSGTVFTSLLAMDKLALDIGFDIGIGPGSSTHSQAGSIVEHLNIRLGFEDIRLNATAVVAVLADQLSSVRLLRFIEDPLGCLVYPMYTINVTFLDLDIGSLIGPSESGFICSGVDCVLNHVVEVLRVAYADVVMPVTRGGLSSTVATSLNNLLARIIHNMSAPVNSSAVPTSTTVNWGYPSARNRVLSSESPSPLSSATASFVHLALQELLLSSAGATSTDLSAGSSGGAQCAASPPMPVTVPGTEFLDLREWSFLSSLSHGLQTIVDDFYNDFVNVLTCGSAALNISINVSAGAGPGLNEKGIDTVRFGLVGPIEITNLDLVKNISLFRIDSESPYVLHHTIAMLPHRAGVTARNSDLPSIADGSQSASPASVDTLDAFGISLPLSILWKGTGSDADSSTQVSFHEDIRLVLRIGGVDVQLTTFTRINESSLAAQTLGSVFGNNSANDLACILTMFEGGDLNITALNATIPLLEIGLECDACDGKLDLEAIGARLQLPGVRDALRNGIAKLLEWVGEPDSKVLGLLNNALHKKIVDAPSNCSVFHPPAPVTPPPSSTPTTTEIVALSIGFVGCIVIVLVVSLLCCTNRRATRGRRRHRQHGMSFDVVSVGPDGKRELRPFFDDDEDEENDTAAHGDDRLPSLEDPPVHDRSHADLVTSHSTSRSRARSGGTSLVAGTSAGTARARTWSGSLAANLTMDITDTILDNEERRIRARSMSKDHGSHGPTSTAKATTTGHLVEGSAASSSLGKPLLEAATGTGGMQGEPSTEEQHTHVQKSAAWSMCVHGASTALANFGIPFLLLLNVAVFISAHTTVGAEVDAVITLNPIENGSVPVDNSSGTPTQIILSGLYDFSLGDSIRNMWEAKVYPLALLIAVFSGAWPYLKIVLMMFSWLAPESFLSSTRRGHLLQALDALGKWSLIDNYVLVLMMVAFRMHISLPGEDTAVVPEGWLGIDVVVSPGWGIYGFLVAAILSLVCTHLIVFYHRQAVEEEKDVAAAAAMLKRINKLSRMRGGPARVAATERFSNHVFDFALPADEKALHVQLSLFSQVTIFVVICGTLFLTALGVFLQTFQFEFEGLVGLLLESSNSTATNYSLVSVGEAVATSDLSGQPSAGNTYLQVVFFAFACFIPAMHLALLMVLWVAPLNLQEHRHFFVASEVLGAWSSLDVFTVSIVAAIFEISQFAQFLVGDACDGINEILGALLMKELHGDARCFDVTANLLGGFWYLFAAVIAGILVTQSLHRSLERAIHERIEAAKGRVLTIPALIKGRKEGCLSTLFLRCFVPCASRIGLLRVRVTRLADDWETAETPAAFYGDATPEGDE